MNRQLSYRSSPTSDGVLLDDGKVLSGLELQRYVERNGLCPRCGQQKTHSRGLFGRTFEPLTVKNDKGGMIVYKGFCLQPTCFTLSKAKEILGESQQLSKKSRRGPKGSISPDMALGSPKRTNHPTSPTSLQSRSNKLSRTRSINLDPSTLVSESEPDCPESVPSEDGPTGSSRSTVRPEKGGDPGSFRLVSTQSTTLTRMAQTVASDLYDVRSDSAPDLYQDVLRLLEVTRPEDVPWETITTVYHLSSGTDIHSTNILPRIVALYCHKSEPMRAHLLLRTILNLSSAFAYRRYRADMGRLPQSFPLLERLLERLQVSEFSSEVLESAKLLHILLYGAKQEPASVVIRLGMGTILVRVNHVEVIKALANVPKENKGTKEYNKICKLSLCLSLQALDGQSMLPADAEITDLVANLIMSSTNEADILSHCFHILAHIPTEGFYRQRIPDAVLDTAVESILSDHPSLKTRAVGFLARFSEKKQLSMERFRKTPKFFVNVIKCLSVHPTGTTIQRNLCLVLSRAVKFATCYELDMVANQGGTEVLLTAIRTHVQDDLVVVPACCAFLHLYAVVNDRLYYERKLVASVIARALDSRAESENTALVLLDGWYQLCLSRDFFKEQFLKFIPNLLFSMTQNITNLAFQKKSIQLLCIMIDFNMGFAVDKNTLPVVMVSVLHHCENKALVLKGLSLVVLVAQENLPQIRTVQKELSCLARIHPHESAVQSQIRQVLHHKDAPPVRPSRRL